MTEYMLNQSTKDEKKFMVSYLNQATNRIKTIHFGASKYLDYTEHNDEKRKNLYRLRHHKDKINDLTKSGCWAWWLLWSKPSLKDSIEEMEKHFGITIDIFS